MLKIVLAIILLYPGLALAQDASFLGGPQSSISSNNAASPQTLNILQPANPQSLQSADSGAGGISQPTTQQTLQQTQGSDQVKLLLDGEGDGAGRIPEPEDIEAHPPYWALGIPVLIAVALWLRRQRQ